MNKKTRPLSELVGEMEAEHPGLRRRVRLEGIWFDIGELLDDYPELSSSDPESAPLYRAARLTMRMGTIASAARDGVPDPIELRQNLLALAARTVEWIERIDAGEK